MKFKSMVAALSLPAAAWAGIALDQPIQLSVDATRAPERRFRAHSVLAVTPGPLTLVYPKWIPGEHGPTGPIGNIAGLRFRAGGRDLAWQRDSVDMFAFHLAVPPGASRLEVDLDYLCPASSADGDVQGAISTSRLAILPWNTVVLYPAGAAADAVQVKAELTLPPGWSGATALPRDTAARPGALAFRAVSLTTLIDSTVLMGKYTRTVELGGAPGHHLDLAADSEAALVLDDRARDGLQALVSETGALFGTRHYNDYHFLVALSDRIPSDGIEHHQSSDNRLPERAFSDPELTHAAEVADLLPHEMVHSWNGKFQRPLGLTPRNYQEPLQGDLLYAYEGLTQYLAFVLTARAGLFTPADARDHLAMLAAQLDRRSGRSWRPLADTAIAAQLLYGLPAANKNVQRSIDFYDEGLLIWLEADALIRQESRGARSLDDFCRAFLGGPGGLPEPPKVRTYTFAELTAALDRIQPHDWAGFLRERLDRVGSGAPLGGLARCGWQLDYGAEPNNQQKLAERLNRNLDLDFSLGLSLKEDGTILDVDPQLPAGLAGLIPGMRILAVDGARFQPQRMRDALAATPRTGRISFVIDNDEAVAALDVPYAGGPRSPRLVPIPGAEDRLSAITARRAR